MLPLFDLTALDASAKDTLILELTAQVEVFGSKLAALEAQCAELSKENAELRAKLDLPPKTPSNSSLPPSQGQKPQGQDDKPKAKKKAHPGAHRPLHPDPTSRLDVSALQCQHCHADVTAAPQQAVQAYDRIEIPPIKPDVTRVTLFGGTCPCCRKAFKADAPQGLEPGSPFGPNLRALAIHLRFTQGVSFERLSGLMSDLLGVEISEGALVNIMQEARTPFSEQTAIIREQLLRGTILESDETRMRVGKKSWWLWVFHHDKRAVFVCEETRSKAVPEKFLGNHRPLFWVSDRCASQMGWATQNNQVCLSHYADLEIMPISAGKLFSALVIVAMESA